MSSLKLSELDKTLRTLQKIQLGMLKMVRLLRESNDFYAEKASVMVEHSFWTMLIQGYHGKQKSKLWT